MERLGGRCFPVWGAASLKMSCCLKPPHLPLHEESLPNILTDSARVPLKDALGFVRQVLSSKGVSMDTLRGCSQEASSDLAFPMLIFNQVLLKMTCKVVTHSHKAKRQGFNNSFSRRLREDSSDTLYTLPSLSPTLGRAGLPGS